MDLWKTTSNAASAAAQKKAAEAASLAAAANQAEADATSAEAAAAPGKTYLNANGCKKIRGNPGLQKRCFACVSRARPHVFETNTVDMLECTLR